MLVLLGFGMILTFMYLIMSKRLTPVVALIFVPIIFGLLAGGGLELGKSISASIKTVAPTACLLFFAIVYFGTMIDVGMFDPLIKLILKFAHHDPVRLVIGTALLTTIVSLDGDGSTTFIIVSSAFLPIYLRLGMSPWVLTCIAATSNGILNTVPWGGSTARAAAALKVNPVDIFLPMVPGIAVSLVALLGMAYMLGCAERKRLGRVELDPAGGVLKGLAARAMPQPAELAAAGVNLCAAMAAGSGRGIDNGGAGSAAVEQMLQRPNAKPRLTWVNVSLTVGVMSLLVADILPSAVVFMMGTALALMINFPKVEEQSEQIKAHASSIVGVVGMVFAATVLTGILSGSGMVTAMAKWLVTVIPASWGPHLAVVTGLLSIPMTFFTSNDAFYFGVLPILSETASHYGITPLEMARASLVGQPLHQSSPLVASFLLLIGLTKVELGEHFAKTIWRAVAIGLVMLGVGALTNAFPL